MNQGKLLLKENSTEINTCVVAVAVKRRPDDPGLNPELFILFFCSWGCCVSEGI